MLRHHCHSFCESICTPLTLWQWDALGKWWCTAYSGSFTADVCSQIGRLLCNQMWFLGMKENSYIVLDVTCFWVSRMTVFSYTLSLSFQLTSVMPLNSSDSLFISLRLYSEYLVRKLRSFRFENVWGENKQLIFSFDWLTQTHPVNSDGKLEIWVLQKYDCDRFWFSLEHRLRISVLSLVIWYVGYLNLHIVICQHLE